MINYLNEAQDIETEIVQYRRYLHAHPELDLNLPITTEFIIEKLNSFGIETQIISDSAVVALLGKPNKKTILLRADTDAIQVNEAVDSSFKSVHEGIMHACGHDVHTAMLLGAAKIIKKYEHLLCGQVKLMFQPGEETLKGALAMIDAGILENPKVDAAIALHVFPAMYEVSTGTVSIQDGPIMAGSKNFQIDIIGKGGHGAYPESTIDPINIANTIYNQVNAIKMREIAATDPVVITFGKFSFGATFNVIPNEGVMQGTLRYFNNETGEYVLNRIEEIAKSTTELFKGEIKFTKLGHTPPNINNKKLADASEEILKKTLPDQYVQNLNLISMGSEDFAYLSSKIPTLFIPITAGRPSDGFNTPLHNPHVTIDESVIPYGIATLTSLAFEWLQVNE